MNRIALIAALVAGTASLVGCAAESTKLPAGKTTTASTAEKLTVTGSVSSKLGTDNARAVAVGANGKQVWTYLDKHGDFTLKLPVGTSYRVVIANQLATGGAQKIIGKVALPTDKSNTQWIKADKADKVDLGVLRKPETATATATDSTVKTHSLKISCGCSDDGSGDPGMGGGDWGGGGDTGSDWGGGGGDVGGGWGGGGGSDTGSDWGGGGGGGGWMGSDYGGGDWGNGYCDDGFGGGYGYDQGGWSDSASGWDTGSSYDPSAEDHTDDNPCFGDDEEGSGWGSSSGGGWSTGVNGANVDPAACDVCSGGADAVILAPSNKDCGSWGDASISDSKFEPATCPLQTGTTTTATTSSSSSSGSVNTTKALAGSTGAVQSKAVGETCSVKAECGIGDSCIAGKCVAN